jgi:hypothetical protein
MTRAIHPHWVRAAFAVVVLALAALVLRPLVAPLAAEIWPSAPAVADRGDDASSGVLPTKTVLRLASKLRHDDPSSDPPALVLAVADAVLVTVLPTPPAFCVDTGDLLPASRPVAHRPRGPPGSASQPNASPQRAQA